MVFEHPRDYFHLKDSASGFFLFQLCSYSAQGHIPPQIARVLGATCLLTMTKPSSEVRPIVMSKTLHQLTTCTLFVQFREDFATHISPHQFGVTTKGGFETIIHNIRCTLNLYPDWVAF
jgi:hypothetical protein